MSSIAKIAEEEREHQVIGVVGATVVSLALAMIMIFVQIFQVLPKNPEVIDYVEVNFGTDLAGYGKIQTRNKASDSPRAEDVKKSEEVKSKVERVKAAPITPKVEAPKTVKTPVAVKPPITSKAESHVEVKEPKTPPKEVKTPPKATPPVETPPKPAPEKKIDQDGLFKKSSGSKSSSNGTSGTASGTGGNNNGDKPGSVGDQGNPNGKIDAGSLYGKPGGAKTGMNLNISGWGMGRPPKIDDDSDESGKIVFEITVDDTGDVINVRVKETTVGQSLVEEYKRAVSRMKLVPKSDNPPPTSKGTLTFILKSR